jgi:hypothetical protein
MVLKGLVKGRQRSGRKGGGGADDLVVARSALVRARRHYEALRVAADKRVLLREVNLPTMAGCDVRQWQVV